MKIFFTALGLLFFTLPLRAEDLISRDDARAILNMPEKAWNAQVRLATSAGLSQHQEAYGGTLRQLIKGPDWELSTLPLYGGIKDAPNAVELKIAYKKGNPAYLEPNSQAEAVCKKAFSQLKVEFSFLCAYRKTSEELRYTFLISRPGARKDIDALNARGAYAIDQETVEADAASVAKKLIPTYWAQLDAWAENRTATKQELIEIATRDLPPICGKLVTSYALASGKSPNSSKEYREEWDFNSDFCVKATIHRRFPQPEFENPKIVEMLCERHKKYEFNYNLCKRAGVTR